MLSICIPVYNYDVGRLVQDLHLQAEKSGCLFEILLIDDASDEEFRLKNQAIELESVRYIQLEENIGRAKIRNLLAEEAYFPYLLFMDCDSGISSEWYIENYIHRFEPHTICCGGRIYEGKEPADPAYYLRWKYGVARECASALERKRNPNLGFQTNNFMIHKRMFDKVKFNEELEGYGHEDTLFGLELIDQEMMMRHIDNPLIHLGLESASVFLDKTVNAVSNLHRIELYLQIHHSKYIKHFRLIRTKLFLQKFYLLGFASKLFSIMRKPMESHLLGKKPSLKIFDLYRLGLLCQETVNSKLQPSSGKA